MNGVKEIIFCLHAAIYTSHSTAKLSHFHVNGKSASSVRFLFDPLLSLLYPLQTSFVANFCKFYSIINWDEPRGTFTSKQQCKPSLASHCVKHRYWIIFMSKSWCWFKRANVKENMISCGVFCLWSTIKLHALSKTKWFPLIPSWFILCHND